MFIIACLKVRQQQVYYIVLGLKILVSYMKHD